VTIVRVFIAAALLALPSVALAQTAPSPTPAPSASPAPAATPNAIGAAFGANDPCTSLSAIVSRPTVTNSVCTVRPNHVEIETGYQNTTADGGGSTVAYPQTAIRIGTTIPALEFDIAPPSINRSSSGGVATTGTTDVGAGLKYVFGYSPKASWGGQVFFTEPTGTNGFSSNGTNATYALQGSYTLNSVFSLAGGVQDLSIANNGNRYTSIVPSLVLSASLPNGNGLYAEASEFTRALGPGTPTRTQFIVGALRDVGQRLQVDVEGGWSPTVSTGKYRYVGFGLSYYF